MASRSARWWPTASTARTRASGGPCTSWRSATCRDEHTETWWALEVEAGPYGPTGGLRAIVATTDPATLPDHTTWYLAGNLPTGEADLAEIVRLYGLRMWVEQSYKH